jgi:hypothetical protein
VPGEDVPGIDAQGFVVPRHCFFQAALLSQAIGEIELRLGIGLCGFLAHAVILPMPGWGYRCFYRVHRIEWSWLGAA